MPTTFPLVRVVGMHFRGEHAKTYAAALQPGDSLLLEREPDNEYDVFAIKVITPERNGEPGFHLGYIEKGAARWIATDMDEGMEFTCTVRDVLIENNNHYPRVYIEEIVAEAGLDSK
jgi:hypothetical protein